MSSAQHSWHAWPNKSLLQAGCRWAQSLGFATSLIVQSSGLSKQPTRTKCGSTRQASVVFRRRFLCEDRSRSGGAPLYVPHSVPLLVQACGLPPL